LSFSCYFDLLLVIWILNFFFGGDPEICFIDHFILHTLEIKLVVYSIN